jgi:hypothetical protein
MTLEDRISEILEGIEIDKKESGKLVLYSSALEEEQKPSKLLNMPIIGKLIGSLKRSYKISKKDKLKHLIAKNLEDYLTEKRDTSFSLEDYERYDHLLNAFETYHNIKINDLEINQCNIKRPNLFIRNPLLFTGAVVTAYSIFPSISELPLAVQGSMAFGLICSYATYKYSKEKDQTVNFPLPSLDEIKEDMSLLSQKYIEEKEKIFATNTETDFIKPEELKEKISELTKIVSEGTVSKIIEFVATTEDTIRLTSTIDETPDIIKIPQVKAKIDEYLQKYCPTKDLGEVKIKLINLWGASGRVDSERNEVLLSPDIFGKNWGEFYITYPHEIGHLDGMNAEGWAQYVTLQVESEMAKDFPDETHNFNVCKELLRAVTHTYVIERKKEIRKYRAKLGHLKDMFEYSFANLKSLFTKKEPDVIDVGINREIHDELIGLGVPANIIESIFYQFENPSLKTQFFFAAQTVLKNDEFASGYTKDLYEIVCHNGGVEKYLS